MSLLHGSPQSFYKRFIGSQLCPPLLRPLPLEVKFHYAGLLNAPVLVARTGTAPWEAPKGPEGYRKLKQLKIVGNHVLTEDWENTLAPKIHDPIFGECEVDKTHLISL